MKNNIVYPFSLLLLLIYSPLSYAIPPYFGVSVHENLSFTRQNCLAVAKKTLTDEGFQKIVQYKTSSTLFAAYRNENPYHYKALVKCLPESGVIIVVAVADKPRNAKKKADSLRRQIQQSSHIKPAPVVEEITEEVLFVDAEEGEVTELMTHAYSEDSDSMERDSTSRQTACFNTNESNCYKKFTKTHQSRSNKTSEAWQDTVLDRKNCLTRAESSLRDSGFYRNFGFDDDSIYGRNHRKYKAVIRCLISESLILFQVTGKSANMRFLLLDKLQKNF